MQRPEPIATALQRYIASLVALRLAGGSLHLTLPHRQGNDKGDGAGYGYGDGDGDGDGYGYGK